MNSSSSYEHTTLIKETSIQPAYNICKHLWSSRKSTILHGLEMLAEMVDHFAILNTNLKSNSKLNYMARFSIPSSNLIEKALTSQTLILDFGGCRASQAITGLQFGIKMSNLLLQYGDTIFIKNNYFLLKGAKLRGILHGNSILFFCLQ